ncbi:MAG: GNAT family N-acetyltransferase [Candidatus Aminicenantes bacterium]|nr:GNAT family N-acetyltransferase [Candidatus Aminicenantes bacterium]
MRFSSLDSDFIDDKSPVYRLFKHNDFPRLSELIKTIKPEIAGMRSVKLYNAICMDALSNKDIVIIVAEERSSLIGFNITVVERRRFFRYFLFRHPVLSLKIALQRGINFLRGFTVKERTDPLPCREALPYILKTDSGRSWKDSSPDIAKIIFTAVRDGYRGRRVSVGIGEFLLHILEERGVGRLDTLVDPQNLPSIRLTHRLGFRIERKGRWLLGSVDIGKKTQSNPQDV